MRTKKAIKNIIASMIAQIVGIICGLITPRLILASFGSTYNGVISSATQFLSFITILNMGISGATRVALYKTLANNDVAGTSRIMKATKQYMRKVAFILVGYAIILCFIYPLISHNELNPIENAALIGIVSISSFAEYYFGISNTTLLTADQSSYVINTLSIAKTIINTIVTYILIKRGLSIYIVKLASALIFFVSPAILEFYVTKKYKLDNQCEPDNTGIKNRGAVAFHSIANIVHNNTDLIVLTLFTDAKVISVYTVYYLVVGKIKSLMTVFTTGLEAAFGNMWVKKEMDSLQQNFRMFEFGIAVFVTVMFSCIGVLIIPFIALYTRNVTDVNYIRIELAILITITEAIYCIRQPYLTLVQATGSYKETKTGAMFEAIINLAISLILVVPLGINGVMIGTLVANLFRTTQYSIYVSKHILKRDYKQIILRVIWIIIVCGMIVAVSFYITKDIGVATSWKGWIIKSLVVFGISCVVTLIMSLVFYRNDFVCLKKALLRAMPHKQ